MDQYVRAEKLAENLLVFIQKVHDKEGLDKELLSVILQEFHELTEIIKDNKAIPKVLVMILIDMVAVLHTDALYYKDDEEQSEIYLAADQLAYAAYELCS